MLLQIFVCVKAHIGFMPNDRYSGRNCYLSGFITKKKKISCWHLIDTMSLFPGQLGVMIAYILGSLVWWLHTFWAAWCDDCIHSGQLGVMVARILLSCGVQHFDDSAPHRNCVVVIDNGKGMSPRQLNNWAIYRLSKFIRREKNFKKGCAVVTIFQTLTHTHARTCAHTHTHTHTHSRVSRWAETHRHGYACTHHCDYSWTEAQIYTHTFNMCVWCACACVCVCVYVCVRMCAYKREREMCVGVCVYEKWWPSQK